MGSDVLLVGETNPFGGDPAFALYHQPRYSSGNQLRLILGLTDDEYEALDKRNLCLGRWSVRHAREAWAHTMPRPLIVLLGTKVRAATSGPAPFETERRGPSLLLGLPHPSGLNRTWHEPGMRRRARDCFLAARKLAAPPPSAGTRQLTEPELAHVVDEEMAKASAGTREPGPKPKDVYPPTGNGGEE